MLADARTMSAHVVETTCELSAFIKGGVMAAGSERDAGFCSGGDEDDNMSGLHSPSASEDSVEVQVTPISLRNKRKLAEPRKIQEPSTAPLKKRRFEHVERTATTVTTSTPSVNRMDSVVQDEESRPAGSPSPSPFRPWSSPATSKNGSNINNNNNNEAKSSAGGVVEHQEDSQEGSVASVKRSEEEILRRHDESRWIEEENKRREEESRRRYEARIQQEVLTRLQESDLRQQQQQQQHQQKQQLQHRPLSPVSPQLLLASSSSSSSVHSVQSQRRESRQQQRFEPPPPAPASTGLVPPHPRLQEEPLSLVLRGETPRVPAHPAVNGSYERTQSSTPYNNEHVLHSSPHHHQDDQSYRTSANDHPRHHQPSQTQQQQQQQQRNYKNMTRERRIEANARERTRVHTISAAFDTLRRSIPAYSHNQKLSKLSVLRIACSYIMTLSKIANTPVDEPTTSESLGACVDLVSRTIQTEGKLRKKKDE